MQEPRLTDSDFQAVRKANLYYKRNELEVFNKFSRFGFLDMYNPALNLREYLFFTKPNLHLFNSSAGSEINYQIKNIPFFEYAFNNYKEVYESLQASVNKNGTPFINILTNQVNSNLDLPAITTDIVDGPSTAYGTQIKYQMATLDSDQNFDFSLEFKDRESLDVYMLFKLWNEYESNKDKISPPDPSYYTINKVLHDEIAIYKFIVGDDAKSLIYWAKLYGVIPKGVPRDAFGNINTSGGISFTENFHADFVEDFDPIILSDFNSLVMPYIKNKNDIPIYDNTNNCINGEWAHMPYFTAVKRGLGKRAGYDMRWR